MNRESISAFGFLLSLSISAHAAQPSIAGAAHITPLYTGSRVTRDIFTSGDFVVFAQEHQNIFQVINYKTGKSMPSIAAASNYPAAVFALPGGDWVGLSFEGNQAALIDGTTLVKKAVIDLGGYSDSTGFVPYWMMGGCAMPDGDLYFVSSTDVALVHIAAGALWGKTIATQESAGLSGSTEIACSHDKLYVANHQSLMTPDDDQILVINREGRAIDTLAVPGLMHLKAQGDRLVVVRTQTHLGPGLIQLMDTTGDRLTVVAEQQDFSRPQMIAFDRVHHRVLVSEKSPAGFISLDDSTFSLPRRTSFLPADGISTPRGIAVTEDGSGVVVESNGSVFLAN